MKLENESSIRQTHEDEHYFTNMIRKWLFDDILMAVTKISNFAVKTNIFYRL